MFGPSKGRLLYSVAAAGCGHWGLDKSPFKNINYYLLKSISYPLHRLVGLEKLADKDLH